MGSPLLLLCNNNRSLWGCGQPLSKQDLRPDWRRPRGGRGWGRRKGDLKGRDRLVRNKLRSDELVERKDQCVFANRHKNTIVLMS